MLFLSSLDISGNRACSDGVTKKILLEIKTFRELGYSVEYIVRIDGKVYLVKNDGQKTELTYYDGVFYKTMARVYKVLRGSYETPNVIYVRYEGNSIEMWRFLAKMKRSHHNIKIIAELPTYMGKWEQGGFMFCAFRHILNDDGQFRKHALHRVLHHIAAFFVIYLHIGNSEIGIVPYILRIGQTYLDIVPVSQSPGLFCGEEWLYEIGNSQYLIMPFRKSKALACYLLSTATMFFLN